MLSSNARFDEQGQAAIIRDLERHELLLGGGDGVPQSANDQTVEQDGGAGSPAATQEDMDAALAELRDYFNGLIGAGLIGALPSVSYPISIANGGTGASSVLAALSAFTLRRSSSTIYTSGSGTFSPSKDGLLTTVVIGGGGGGSSYVAGGNLGYIAPSSGGSPTVLLRYAERGGGGGAGGIIVAVFSVTAGEVFNYAVGSGGAVDNDGADSTVAYASGGSLGAASLLAGGGQKGCSYATHGSMGGTFFISYGTGRGPTFSGAAGSNGQQQKVIVLNAAISMVGCLGGTGINYGGALAGAGGNGQYYTGLISAEPGVNGAVGFYEQ
jgi:hypothetical protein